VTFKQIQPQRPGRFINALQRRAPIIGQLVKIKRADIEYPFEHGEAIIILWKAYQYTQSLQGYRRPS
jgi:hypothetical protein